MKRKYFAHMFLVKESTICFLFYLTPLCDPNIHKQVLDFALYAESSLKRRVTTRISLVVRAALALSAISAMV